jgi:hypothetical protein
MRQMFARNTFVEHGGERKAPAISARGVALFWIIVVAVYVLTQRRPCRRVRASSNTHIDGSSGVS